MVFVRLTAVSFNLCFREVGGGFRKWDAILRQMREDHEDTDPAQGSGRPCHQTLGLEALCLGDALNVGLGRLRAVAGPVEDLWIIRLIWANLKLTPPHHAATGRQDLRAISRS